MIKRVKARPFSYYGACFLGGLLASLALPPIGFWIAVFALSVPLIGAVHRAEDGGSLWASAMAGWMAGTGWFVFSLSWISNALMTSGGAHMLLIPFTLLGLPAFLGLFWGAAFAVSHYIKNRLRLFPSLHLTSLIMAISLFEYCRGFVLTGFPWNAPGLVLAAHHEGLMIASVAGYWGGGLLVLMVAALPALIIISGRRMAAMVILMMGVTSTVAHHSGTVFDTASTGMTVRILQPNIPQNDKWNGEKRRRHLSDLVVASRKESDTPLDLLVWPETAFAGIYERERGVLSAIAQAASAGKTPVLTGVLTQKDDPFRLYNSAILFNPDGSLSGQISKRHLVPFGEFAPFRSFIPFVDVIAGPLDFSEGSGPQSVSVNGINALTLICYEVIFPSAVHHAVDREGADIIIALTNDAWFGNTIGPRQHLAMAQFRSAELGIPMVRSANTGVSAFINSFGHVEAYLDYDQTGYIDRVIGPSRQTLYGQIGDWIYFLIMIIFAGGAICIGLTTMKPKE